MSTTSATTSKNISGLTAKTMYEFQVQTVCANGSSAFSASSIFTTLGETASCTANVYEPNNTMSQLTPISINTEIGAMIETASDVDWFSFSNSAAQSNIQVRLYNLPKDYSLKLFRSGAEIANSANVGTVDEVINYNTTTVGSYWIRVFGNSSNFSNTQCYTVKASTGGTPFLFENTNARLNASKKNIRIYPNPSTGEFVINYTAATVAQVVVKVLDLSGNELYVNLFVISEGENNLKINLPNVAKGLYLIDLNDGTEKTIHKIMIR